MDQKEIYLLQQKGFEKVAGIISPLDQKTFLELLEFSNNFTSKFLDIETLQKKVLAKADLRKRFIEALTIK